MSKISFYNIETWEPSLDDTTKKDMLENLEKGQVLYFPQLAFSLKPHQLSLIDPKYLDQRAKNISYNPTTNKLKGINQNESQTENIKHFMHDFSNSANQLITSLFPHYQNALTSGRTSFRPAEIKGRKTSPLKDDTRLHVDAFSSLPMRGNRILRVFCNINPNNQPRQWNIGEAFEDVIKQFAPSINRPFPGKHTLLNLLGITKQKRMIYDHYMLNIHNNMKFNEHYQKNVEKEKIAFPSNTTWVVYTDLVSHAALSGQHLLEQTFYLPAEAQRYPEWAPINQLKKYTCGI